MKISILNGPNLNMLGRREPEIYGTVTLQEIEAMCREHAMSSGCSVSFHQSNFEGEIVGWIQEAREIASGIILNPAGFTSTSIAILDALKTFPRTIVEVHLANIHRREAFRHFSYVSLAATGVICGLGPYGYLSALDFIRRQESVDGSEGKR
ncbi:MAG: type II 3-dehydroquinate dehydratase [Mesorhizobium sp.]|uniref:type II 3-dehydroquinate dehydratase n=1 Tax=Mesorhizobium sp. TaxID=1871066 RepID=UPI000FE59CC8|nr:type II 3-dehydroquinate dehydratase [Mesorhizobium sp.]RWL17925.1 MAG: type II 3-dehydroquinate dehydratase [Mesorhizobium sp.]